MFSLFSADHESSGVTDDTAVTHVVSDVMCADCGCVVALLAAMASPSLRHVRDHRVRREVSIYTQSVSLLESLTVTW